MADLQELLAVSALIVTCEGLLQRAKLTPEEEAEIRRLLTQISKVFGQQKEGQYV